MIESRQEKLDRIFMEIAEKFSELSHCISYQVGCILIRDERIISVGYNGTLPGVINCDELKWMGSLESNIEDHHKWSAANEIHAEMNAILYAAKVGIPLDNSTLYSTVKPCQHCMKNLLQAGVKRIVYKYPYDKEAIGDTVNEFIKINNIIVEKI